MNEGGPARPRGRCSTAFYDLGMPTVGLAGGHYQLCWAHAPSDDVDHFRFQVRGCRTWPWQPRVRRRGI